MDDPDVKLLVLMVLVIGLAGALWYYRDDIFSQAGEPAAALPPPADEQAPVPGKPRHPVAAAQDPASSDGERVPLPPLDDSDSYFLLALVDLFGADVRGMLVRDALIDRFVATIDNLPRSRIAEKIRPVGRLPEPFVADAANDDDFYLGDDNYVRYDFLVSLIERTDADDVAAMYRRFYPLLQQSYVRLGYPDGYFNDRVVDVIDHLLATPQPDKPVRLVRPHVLYQYADAELEALSSGQKLLLRMGNDNAAVIKRALRELRTLISTASD